MDPLGIETGVLEERFHVGIHTFPSHAPGLDYQRLFSERQTLYCGRDHPLFSVPEADLDPQVIEAEPFVRRAYYGGALQTGAFHPKDVIASADSMEAIAILIRSHKFIGHLPANWVKRSVKQGQLRALLPERFSYQSQFEVVVRTGARLTRLINTFLDELYCVYQIERGASGRKRRAAN